MAELTIKDVIIVRRESASFSSEPTKRMNEKERVEMVDSLLNDVKCLMDHAFAKDNKKENTEQTELKDIKQKDPNLMRRLITNEFFFYTQEPLTVQEFETLQSKIADLAKAQEAGIQLILGSFAVKTDDNKVMNVTPHITCGPSPAFHFIVKNYVVPEDKRFPDLNSKEGGKLAVIELYDYKTEEENKENAAIVDAIKITIDEIPQKLTFNNVVSCKTPGGVPFLTVVDICVDYAYRVGKSNVKKLLNENPQLENQPVSHVLVSNTYRLRTEMEHCSLGVIAQADPEQSHRYLATLKVIEESKKINDKPFVEEKDATIYHVSSQKYPSLKELLSHEKSEAKVGEEWAQLMEKKQVPIKGLDNLNFRTGNKDDEYITRYSDTQEARLMLAYTLQEAEEILKEMNNQVTALNANEIVKFIKRRIDDLKKPTRFFAEARRNLAERIEMLMRKIPLKGRENFPQHVEPTILEALEEALTTEPGLCTRRRAKTGEKGNNWINIICTPFTTKSYKAEYQQLLAAGKIEIKIEKGLPKDSTKELEEGNKPAGKSMSRL